MTSSKKVTHLFSPSTSQKRKENGMQMASFFTPYTWREIHKKHISKYAFIFEIQPNFQDFPLTELMNFPNEIDKNSLKW